MALKHIFTSNIIRKLKIQYQYKGNVFFSIQFYFCMVLWSINQKLNINTTLNILLVKYTLFLRIFFIKTESAE